MGALDGLIRDHVVALKVCELCGRLYGQRNGQAQYCAACEFELRDFPAIGSRKLRGRKIDPGSKRQLQLVDQQPKRRGRPPRQAYGAPSPQPFTLEYLAASTEDDL
jgi:hypothetical protein